MSDLNLNAHCAYHFRFHSCILIHDFLFLFIVVAAYIETDILNFFSLSLSPLHIEDRDILNPFRETKATSILGSWQEILLYRQLADKMPHTRWNIFGVACKVHSRNKRGHDKVNPKKKIEPTNFYYLFPTLCVCKDFMCIELTSFLRISRGILNSRDANVLIFFFSLFFFGWEAPIGMWTNFSKWLGLM